MPDVRQFPPMKRHAVLTRCCSALLALTVAADARAGAVEPFDYFHNSWNVIGLKDYKDGTRVTPDNDLLLGAGSRFRIRYGRELNRLRREQTKTLMDGWLPVILLSARDGDVRYEFTLWATPLPTVQDWKAAFDRPSEGENYLNWIRVRMSNTGAEAMEARLRCELLQPMPAPWSRFAEKLEPGASAEHVVCVPFSPLPNPEAFRGQDAALWLERTAEYWRGLLATGAQIETPCEKSNQTLKAAHVCQFIAADHGSIHAGEGFYDEFYIRDAAYQVMQLQEAGFVDAVRSAMLPYLESQLPDGRFETQKGQLDANGQAVWVLWQYYKITGHRQWLEEVYPRMRKSIDWTMQARRGAPAESPYAGLLPNAVADGEYLWDGKHHIVGYDLWNLRAMLCTAEAAGVLGKEDEATALRKEADDYRKAIVAAAKKTANSYFPASYEGKGTFWGNTETLWPTEIVPYGEQVPVGDFEALANGTISYARNELGGGFVEGTIRWMGMPDAIHPYMSAYTTMADLIRGHSEQVVKDYYWYLLHSTAAHAFPEGIFYKRRFAWSDTIPHATGASNFAVMLRHMLVHERGDELHLLPAVPDWWLGEGREIRVERAQTHFGELSLRVRGTAEGVQVEFKPPQRVQPKRVVLNLPESRPLVGALEGVRRRKRPDHEKRWDFPTVVKMYEQTAPPFPAPIENLVDLPLDAPLDERACRMLDISKVANTDPLTAPFGVKDVGKLVFSGLSPGRQFAGGVPFRIIDPQENDGRGFVVMHSDKAPQDRSWPREVEIPVKARGTRLFFLGNVHGWEPSDPGTGPRGAVAEYVVHYADGQMQTVPLVTGLTIDEWTSAPSAADVIAGLRGDPWHLNVLGVRLRPVEVTKIVFRDLGTPAAPLLAGITLEEAPASR